MSYYNECDICGDKNTWCESLVQDYKVKGVDNVCGKCGRKINDHLWKLRKLSKQINQSFLKTFVRNLVKKVGKGE